MWGGDGLIEEGQQQPPGRAGQALGALALGRVGMQCPVLTAVQSSESTFTKRSASQVNV